MRVGVVGGGMLGLTLAYELSRAGIEATVFEGQDRAGGLLDVLEVDGVYIDKYYHCILSGDADLLELVDQLGLRDRVRFTATSQGFYSGGQVYPITSGKDFLLFPPLSLVERLRLGLTILQALRVADHERLEAVSVEDWLVRLGGRGAFEKLWKPLLRAKFDGSYDRTPATYIWSRLKRVGSTRAAGGQRERMGYFVGSYKILVERLVAAIGANGSAVRLGQRVEQLLVEGDRVVGLRAEGERFPFDAVVVTTPLPVLHHLVPEAYRARLDVPLSGEYLGIVCGLLLLDRSLTSHYTLNIADEQIPFTGLIETTNLIAPEHVGGYHLVYLPKYVTPDSAYLRYSDDELGALYLRHLRQMFPAFEASWVKHRFVFRERFVEPLHQVGRRRPIMPVESSIPGLFVVNNGQIYPELTNCQASVHHARQALPRIQAYEAGRSSAEPVGALAAGPFGGSH